MIYIGYSELTHKYYLLPKSKKESKVDITEDIKEILSFESSRSASSPSIEAGYRANFLWGFQDDTIESLGYEFANGKTEAYLKEVWESLIEKIKDQSSGIEAGLRSKEEILTECYRTKETINRIARNINT